MVCAQSMGCLAHQPIGKWEEGVRDSTTFSQRGTGKFLTHNSAWVGHWNFPFSEPIRTIGNLIVQYPTFRPSRLIPPPPPLSPYLSWPNFGGGRGRNIFPPPSSFPEGKKEKKRSVGLIRHGGRKGGNEGWRGGQGLQDHFRTFAKKLKTKTKKVCCF